MQQKLSTNPRPLLPEEFFKAVVDNNMAYLKSYLSSSYGMNPIKFTSGPAPSTALTTATHMGHKEVVEMLISSGCDVNVADAGSKMTPLMHAALGGHSDVVTLLLGKGADVNALDAMNRPAIYFAVGNGKKDIVKTLLKRGAEICPKIPKETRVDFTEEMRSVLHDRRDYRGDCVCGNNAFLKACSQNNVPVVREFLKSDVSVLTSLNQDGDSALHIAVRSGFADVTRVLLSYKSLLDQANNVGATSLHVACRSLFTDVHQHVMDIENVAKCTELLIAAGCDVTAKDTEGHSALHALLMGSFHMRGPDSRLGRLRFRLVQLILSSAKYIAFSDLANTSQLSTDLTEEHSDILQWLHSFLRTPRSLQHMCRVAVRQSVGNTRLDRIGELPCTPNLIRYVSLV